MEGLLTGLGLSGSAGLNAYLPLFVLGMVNRMGWIELHDPYTLLGSYPILGILGVLLLIEITADKIPAIDTLNDGVQTFIRPMAGSLLMAASIGAFTTKEVAFADMLLLLGGTVSAGGVHTIKAFARPVVTVTTGGLGNIVISVIEDVISLLAALMVILLPFMVIFFSASVVTILGWWIWDQQRVRRYLAEKPKNQLVIFP